MGRPTGFIDLIPGPYWKPDGEGGYEPVPVEEIGAPFDPVFLLNKEAFERALGPI